MEQRQTFQATWVGRFITDGYAIADEYRMTGPSGEVLVPGVNIRAYYLIKQIWDIKWLDALAGKWVDSDRRNWMKLSLMDHRSPMPSKSRWPSTLIYALLIHRFPRRIHVARRKI